MKNKACYSKLSAAAIACLLAITCSANAAPKKAQSSACCNKPSLEDSSRDNHNSLLPASFYDSNHEFEG